MYISVNLKDGKEIKLFPARKEIENGNVKYDLFPSDDNKPLISFELDSVNKLFKNIKKDPSISTDDSILKEKLDELLLNLIEFEQSGSEENESETKEEKPYDPDAIRVETKTFSLRQICDMIKDGDIILISDFQRNLVWDNYRKSKLIESILLRIPLPMFYFSQDVNGKITVVDGLQRLSAIKDFVDNKLKLKDLEYLENCNNKYYKKDKDDSIDTKYYRWFNMTQITVNVVDPSSPSQVKYDIFRRINTGGKPLNAQEIRNCLASDNLRKLLKQMVSLESFKEATLGSIKETRMADKEHALRFIYFYRQYEKDKTLKYYNGKIETELNDLVDKMSKLKSDEISRYVELFDNAMKNAHFLFGEYAFRKCQLKHLEPNAYMQLINKALFVTWSVLLSKYDSIEIKKKNKSLLLAAPLAEKITNDENLFLYLTYSTNSKANMQASFKSAEEIISNNLIL